MLDDYKTTWKIKGVIKMETYEEKIIGKTIDTIYCPECKTFEIMTIGFNYNPNCLKCKAGLMLSVITINEIGGIK